MSHPALHRPAPPALAEPLTWIEMQTELNTKAYQFFKTIRLCQGQLISAGIKHTPLPPEARDSSWLHLTSNWSGTSLGPPAQAPAIMNTRKGSPAVFPKKKREKKY